MHARLILAALLGIASRAHADCATDINRALDQAKQLPDTRGRGSLLEEIERARISRHEGDEAGCQEQIDHVLRVLRTVPRK
jgi:hypothetical protein